MVDKLATLSYEGDVSIITLDDGKANVFSEEMTYAVNDCLDKVPTESGSLIITGRPGMFSAGFDLKVIASGDVSKINKSLSKKELKTIEVDSKEDFLSSKKGSSSGGSYDQWHKLNLY